MNSPKHPPKNLWELRQQSNPKDVAFAQTWARKQADSWPSGTYSHNDFPPFFEKGFLTGCAHVRSEHEETVSTLLEALKETLVYLRDAQVIGDNNPDPTSDHGRWLAAIAKAEAHD